MRTLILAVLLASTLAVPMAAQDSVLTRLLAANRHPLGLVDGRLTGAGGRALIDGGLASRFFLIGEEHGVAEMPAVVQALLTELRPAGYNTFAIEVSPLQGMRLDSMARGRVPLEALDTLLSSWLTAVPFYTLRQERDLLAAAMSAQGSSPPLRIWGLDYEVSADRLLLRELEQLAPAGNRDIVRRARELADSGFAALVTQGNPTRLFAWSAPDSVFIALRTAFGSNPPQRASAIIDLLDRTARINRHFLNRRGYESNLDRSAFLRQNFAAALAATPDARVVFKFGGAHMMRGWTYTHTLDLGTAAAIEAESRGDQSYHVLMLGGPGAKTTRMNIVKARYEPIGSAELDEPVLAWLRPAVPDSGWVVFDMRPVRSAYLARGRQTLSPVQDRFLLAYDAIVVLSGSTPADPLPLLVGETPTP